MQCPMKYVRDFLQGTDYNTDYARYLTLGAVLISQKERIKNSDEHLLRTVYQCVGLWYELSKVGGPEKRIRYIKICSLLTNLLDFLKETRVSDLQKVIDCESETKVLVSMARRRDLYPGELLFLAAHWSSEMVLEQAVIDLVIAAEFLKQGDLESAVIHARSAPDYITFTTEMLKVLDDFLSVDDFLKLRKDKLGQGVGSPGIEGARRCARRLDKDFEDYLTRNNVKKTDIVLQYVEQYSENQPAAESEPLWQLNDLLEEINLALKIWGLAHADLAEHKLPPGYTGVAGMTPQALRERAQVPVLMRTWLSFDKAREMLVKLLAKKIA